MFNLETFLNNRHLISEEILFSSMESDVFRSGTICLDSSYVLAYFIPKKADIYLIKRKMKLGKYLRLAYPKLTPANITHICEKIKSILNDSDVFKIVEGDEIKRLYFRTNYVPNHCTLSNSCMRYLKCQRDDYFKIYGDNAKMLVMTPKRGKRILGRAILWEYNGTYLMDRVYYAEPYIEYKFYDYAKKMGYGVLHKNCWVPWGDTQEWLLPSDNYKDPVKLRFQIKLKEPCINYPYMDSLCYLDKDKTILSTYPINGGYVLHSTDGNTQIYYYDD